MIKKAAEAHIEKKNIRGGAGEVELRHKLTQEETFGKCRICAEICIEPGQSIGEHPHEIEAEIFYMLSGELVSINEDKTEEVFSAGDMMITGGGEKHSVRNDSAENAVMLAIVIN